MLWNIRLVGKNYISLSVFRKSKILLSLPKLSINMKVTEAKLPMEKKRQSHKLEVAYLFICISIYRFE